METRQFVYYIQATPEKIWKALTDPGVTKKYWDHQNLSDWKAGSTWEHRNIDASQIDILGKVLESGPPRRLVLTWALPADATLEANHTRVLFELEPIATGYTTRLAVTHGHLESGTEMLRGIEAGWPMVLSNLKTLLETGHPLPRLY